MRPLKDKVPRRALDEGDRIWGSSEDASVVDVDKRCPQRAKMFR